MRNENIVLFVSRNKKGGKRNGLGSTPFYFSAKM